MYEVQWSDKNISANNTRNNRLGLMILLVEGYIRGIN